MTVTVALTPGPITVASTNASVIGAGNQWADGTDATYAEMTTGSTQGDLTHYTGPDSTSFGYSFRSSITGTEPCYAYIDLYGLDPAPHFLMRMGGPDGRTKNPDLGITTESGAGALEDWFVDYGLTPEGFLDELRTGVRAVVSTSAGATLRVYEFTIFVFYEAPLEPPILRVHPRSDGRGLSSARRVWPPSKTVQDNRWLPFGGGYR